MSAHSAFQRPSGVIEHLIKLPEDDSTRRLRVGVMVSVAVNVFVCVLTYASSQLRSNMGALTPPTNFVDLTFDKLDKVVQKPEVVKPTPPPKPKRERQRVRVTQRVPRKPVPVVRRPDPKPIVQRKPEPVKVAIAPRPQPQPVPKVQPKPTNTVERNVNPVAVNRSNPLNPNIAATSTANPANVNNANPTNARVSTASNSLAAAANNNTSVSAPAASVARNAAVTGATGLASNSRSAVSAVTREREGAASIASNTGGVPLPTGARSAQMAAGVASATATTAGTRGGVTSVGVSNSSGPVNVAAISAPSFVGRRTPALGSTVLIADRATVLTAAMSDEGRANPGLATIQGAKGTIATSVAVGRAGVAGQSGGTASVGSGGRAIGTAADATGANVANASNTGAERGPARGNTLIADLGSRSVASAAGEGRRGDGVARSNDNVGAAAAGTTRSSGSGDGPRGATGDARVSGSGGAGAAAGAGSAGDIRVDSKTNTGGDDFKNKGGKGDGQLARAGEAGGKAGTKNEDAEATSQPDVKLSAAQKKRQFKGRILVQVTVEADGSHEEFLVQGSGDSEIDDQVIKTLKSWKWRAAYRDGVKVKSTKKFNYTIHIDD